MKFADFVNKIVVDKDGYQYKVTYQQDGFLAVLTKVD